MAFNWKFWEDHFPGDAVNFRTGVRESITEFFVVIAGSQVVSSTKDIDLAKGSARYHRDDRRIPDVRIRRISRI
jgi:hypothetical protein